MILYRVILFTFLFGPSSGWDSITLTQFVRDYGRRVEAASVCILKIEEDDNWNKISEKLFYGLRRQLPRYISIRHVGKTDTNHMNERVYSGSNIQQKGVGSESPVTYGLLQGTMIITPLLSPYHATVLKEVVTPTASTMYKWLMISKRNFPELLSEFHLPLINKVTVAVMGKTKVTLYEMYQYSPSYKPKIDQVGGWLPKTSSNQLGYLHTPEVDIIPRRSNLTGFHFRCSYKKTYPFNFKKEEDGHMVYAGSMDMFWLEMQKKLNFSFQCGEDEPKEYGSLRNGTWNGIIGELIEGKADVSPSFLSMTTEKACVVDFILTNYKERWGIIFRKGYSLDTQWTTFTQEFSSTVWLAAATALPLLSLVLYFAVKFSSLENSRVTIPEAFSLVLGSLASQGWWVSLNAISTRIVLLVTMVESSLLYYHYSAYLTSALAACCRGLPFDNLQEIYDARSSLKLITITGSSSRDFFRTSGDQLMKKIWKDMIKPFPENTVDGSTDRSKVIQDEGVGLVTSYSIFKYAINNPCQYAFIPIPHKFIWMGMPLRKDIFIKPVLDRTALKIISSGILDRYQRQMSLSEKSCTTTSIQAFGIKKVGIAFTLLGCAMFLAALMLIIERKLHYRSIC